MQNFRLRQAVVAWLNSPTNSPTWNNVDRHILETAQADNPGLAYTLQMDENINSDGRSRLSFIGGPIHGTPSINEYAVKEPPASTNDTLYTIIGIVLLLVLIAIPIAAIISAFVFHITFLWWLIIGIVAGFLASIVMRGGGYGVIGDVVAGVVGALIGGFLINVWFTNIWVTSIAAFIGACILIMILRAVSSRRSRRRL